MSENRRDFMKTLGKLGAALGITAAASTAENPTKGATQKPTEKPDLKNLDAVTKKAVVKNKLPEYEFGFTGFRSAEENAQLQADVNLVYNQIIDSKHMKVRAMPHMTVPPHVYDFVMKKQAIQDLDPYNWGAVFDIKWVDWRPCDPRFYTTRGTWEAHVKPRYQCVLADHVFVNSIDLPMEYLEQRVENAEEVKKHAKQRCYDELVVKMREVIQLIVDTDRKLNTPVITNAHISAPRDPAKLKGITD